MEAGVSPLLSSIEDAIEAIFLTAHKEDFSMEVETKQVAAVICYQLTSQQYMGLVNAW
jgi:hypothetical protein